MPDSVLGTGEYNGEQNGCNHAHGAYKQEKKRETK